MPASGTGKPVHGVPVLIHYDEDGTRTIGDEVIRSGHAGHPATACWIRTYLLENSPVCIHAGDRRITFRDAAVDFLGAVLSRAIRDCPGNPSVVFAIPAGAPDWYPGWLGTVARGAGVTSWHTVDEHTAAAAGYGLVAGEGQEFLIVRFDETDLTVSVIRSEGIPDHSLPGPMRVGGTACDDTGCRTLDGWIAQEMLARSRMKYSGAKAQRIYDGIMARIGCMYGQLVATGEAVLEVADPTSGTTVSGSISRDDIGRIVAEHEFPSVLDRAIGRARGVARSHGCGEAPPVAVLMTGRGSVIPAVQELVKKRFSDVPVLCDHPFDAVARGAALFRPSADRTDRIRNDYALRYWDPATREHRYRFLVRSGARYPSAGQVARITISASYDGQARLGIPLYEISTSPDAHAPVLELVSDPDGGIRLAGPAEDTGDGSRPVLVNERKPTLLDAAPPALKGEPRFELTFTLDEEKHLRVTARDLVTGTLVKKDAPVHRLT